MCLTVGVLITNYNSWKLALECIQANLKLCGSQLKQIILVDDCSTETPPPETLDARVEVLHNPTNQGFAHSLNIGMAHLQTDIVVIFDADARPLHNYIEIVQSEFASDSTLALLGFQAVDSDGKETPSCDKEPGAYTLILGQALSSRMNNWLSKKEHRLCLFTFGMAFRKSALKDLHGFDERFDWLDVDIDFSMGIHRSNWTLKHCHAVKVFHEGGGTPMLTANRVLKFYKNRWMLLKKFHKLKYPWLARWIILIRLQIEYLFLKVVGKNLYKDKDVWQDKLKGRREIISYCRSNY